MLSALTGIRTSQALADRVSYARDLWPRNHMAVRAGDVAAHKPAGIAWPETTEDVVRIVSLARKHGVPIVPFGAGSGVCGGILPSAQTIVVDLKRMDRWRKFDPDAPTLDVEAGHMGVPLEEKLNAKALTLGHFPSSILCSTSGGWIAARSAGQCSGRYGKIEDMVVSLECVTGAGDVVTLHQRSHGPSLVPIVIGSEGTLAIVTSSVLRLHPLPQKRAFGAWSVPTMKRGWEAMRAIFQAGLRPAVSRLYDPFDAMLARQKKSSGKKKKTAAPGASSAALRTILRKPGLFNAVLESQIAGRAMGGALLVLIFEGDDPDSDMREVKDMMTAHGATDEGEGPARHWLERRYAVSYRQSPVLMSGLFVDTMEVAARWSCLEALYDGVRAALGPDVFVMAHMSHAYPDGCCIYFSFAGSGDDKNDWDASCERRYDRAWKSALAAAVASGGTIAHHHGVGRSKAPALRGEIGSSGIDVVRALKRAFDPDGILNPGALDASRS